MGRVKQLQKNVFFLLSSPWDLAWWSPGRPWTYYVAQAGLELLTHTPQGPPRHDWLDDECILKIRFDPVNCLATQHQRLARTSQGMESQHGTSPSYWLFSVMSSGYVSLGSSGTEAWSAVCALLELLWDLRKVGPSRRNLGNWGQIFEVWGPGLSFAFQLYRGSDFLGFPVLLWDREKQDHGLTPRKA